MFAASLGTTKDLLVVDLAFRVQHKDAGMQISEAQHLFVLLLIKYATLEDRCDTYIFLSPFAIAGRNGQIWGHMRLLVMLPSSTKQLNEIK